MVLGWLPESQVIQLRGRGTQHRVLGYTQSSLRDPIWRENFSHRLSNLCWFAVLLFESCLDIKNLYIERYGKTKPYRKGYQRRSSLGAAVEGHQGGGSACAAER